MKISVQVTFKMIDHKSIIILFCGGILLAIDTTFANRFNAANYPLPLERYALASRHFWDSKLATDDIDYRLPNNTRPLAYDLRLTTNVHLGDFAVNGQVHITIEVLTIGTRTITLHHAQLTVESVKLREISSSGLTEIAVDSPVYTDYNQWLTVTLATVSADLVVGRQYALVIEFNGTLRDDGRGFFRSSYVSDDGSTRWSAGTHFEPTSARYAFPCFDEPGLRSTFAVSITHGSGYFSLSNMPVVSSTVSAVNPRTVTTVFAETPPMPTYLVAYAVTDYASRSHTNLTNSFEHRIFARPNAIDRSDFGLDTGRRALNVFESRFGVRYSLPKMDQIAFPHEPRGAMENWGLIVYNEIYLLYSEDINSFADKVEVAVTIVHEFSHMWFGDHVTNKWWSYNWMKEGMATMYEYRGTGWLFPEWNMMDLFVYEAVQSTMILDASNFTRPMTRDVNSPWEIASNFDSIGYKKAGCVLNMFLNAFTEDKFTSGLTVYLNRHANGATVEDDLFTALQETVIDTDVVKMENFTVANVMSSWTRQSGYPLVSAKRNYAKGSVELQQQRYLADPDAMPDATSWWIPYNLATATQAHFEDTQAEGWLAPNAENVEANEIKSEDWLLVNKRQTGYYRVIYDEKNYALLADALDSDTSGIHAASRSQLLDDLFALAESERLGYGTVLNVAKYLRHEVEYVPWASASRGLMLIDRLQSSHTNFDKYQNFIVKLLTNLYKNTTEPGAASTLHRQHARLLAIRWSCRYGNVQCLVDTHAMLQTVLAGVATVHQDYRAAVLCAGARSVNAQQYEQMWTMFQQETVQSVRNDWIEALGCASQTNLLRSMLERTLNATDAQWNANERLMLLVGITMNRVSVAMDMLTERLEEAIEHYGDIMVNLAIQNVAGYVNSAELRLKFDILVERTKSVKEIQPITVISSLKIIENNDRWIDRNQKVIDDWITLNNGESSKILPIILRFLVIIAKLVKTYFSDWF